VADAAIVYVNTDPAKGEKGNHGPGARARRARIQSREGRKETRHPRTAVRGTFIHRLRSAGQQPHRKRRRRYKSRSRRSMAAHRHRRAGDRHRAGRVQQALATRSNGKPSATPSRYFQAIAVHARDMARRLTRRDSWCARRRGNRTRGALHPGGFDCEAVCSNATRVTHKAMQIHAATATAASIRSNACTVTRDHGIYEGTSEIQRLVIAAWGVEELLNFQSRVGES